MTTENPQHRGPEAVSVLVATRDPLQVRLVAPMLARKLYPGRTFGVVLHHEPAEPPAMPGADRLEWSEAAVLVIPTPEGA